MSKKYEAILNLRGFMNVFMYLFYFQDYNFVYITK